MLLRLGFCLQVTGFLTVSLKVKAMRALLGHVCLSQAPEAMGVPVTDGDGLLAGEALFESGGSRHNPLIGINLRG